MNLKPYATFIEYTIRPLLDDMYELLLKLEKYEIDYRVVFQKLVRLYVIERILNAFASIICTLIVCLTILIALYLFPSIRI